MKKLMLLAAMLAMALVAAAPALAQNTGGQYAIGCVQIQNAVQEVTGQYATGGTNTAGQYNVVDDVDIDVDVMQPGGGGDDTQRNANVDAGFAQYNVAVQSADATITNTLTPTQYANCESVIAQYQGVGDVDDDDTATTSTTTTTTSGGGSSSGGGGASSGGTSSGGGATALPATGGASLLALGAGALLVGGGLLARRIVR